MPNEYFYIKKICDLIDETSDHFYLTERLLKIDKAPKSVDEYWELLKKVKKREDEIIKSMNSGGWLDEEEQIQIDGSCAWKKELEEIRDFIEGEWLNLLERLGSFEKILSEGVDLLNSNEYKDRLLKEKEDQIKRWRESDNSTSSNLKEYKDKCVKLERELRDLSTEKKEKEDKLEEEKRERQNEKLEWEREKRERDTKIARLEEKSRNDDTRKTELTKEVDDKKKEVQEKDNENGRLLIKLDEKSNQLITLRLESNNKDNELRQKNEEIERLKRWVGLSREELLSEKIRLKYGKLEIFANQIEINLQQVSDLCRYCERLIHAQKSCNQANIETHEDNITRVREGLRQRGFQIENIQKFCDKCEKVAKMRVEVNEIRQQQQQYEARQELPPLNNNRIN